MRRVARGGEIEQSVGRVARVVLGTAVGEARIGATGEWRLVDELGRDVAGRMLAGGTVRIEGRGGTLRIVGASTETGWLAGPVIARPSSDGSYATYNARRWRGEVWMHATGGTVTIVNRVPVESYLRGVVPLELGTSAPNERAALEAQAVAARSYVYSRLPEFEPRAAAMRRAAQPFDLRATTSDQVYGGVDVERAAADRAIVATSGLVLRYEGAVVTAPYHSACGGSTAEPAELWNSEREPWLSRVSDRIPGTDRYYCDIAPRFRWTRTWDDATLRGVLTRYLRASSRVQTPVRLVRSLAVNGRTPSGRAASLDIVTGDGTATLRGNDIRFVLRTAGGDILPSTNFIVDSERGGDGRVALVTIRGNGNGHGVGMCQWGAVGRARAGQDFRMILRAYFPRASVEPVE